MDQSRNIIPILAERRKPSGTAKTGGLAPFRYLPNGEHIPGLFPGQSHVRELTKMKMSFLLAALLLVSWNALHAADPLTVTSDFEGASVREVEIDDATRSIHFMPSGDPVRGWPCWWYFRVNGIAPGETITLKLRGSTATVDTPGAALRKPLASVWAMPDQATSSTDGETWLHTEKGERTREQRFGVWVQARQHAWESGSSWVAQGFGEWLLSDSADAAWLRQHAEIFRSSHVRTSRRCSACKAVPRRQTPTRPPA